MELPINRLDDDEFSLVIFEFDIGLLVRFSEERLSKLKFNPFFA